METGDAELTAAGEDLTEWIAGHMRDGGAMPNRYYLEDNGSFILLGQGNHRLVYGQQYSADVGDDEPVFTTPGIVLKVGKFDDPWATQNEILNWEYMPAEIAQYFAPVHDYAADGQWLLMSQTKQGVEPAERDRVEQSIEDAGYKLDDIRTDNMGYLDGDPVVIDYGYRILTQDDDRIGPRSDDYFEPTAAQEEMETLWK